MFGFLRHIVHAVAVVVAGAAAVTGSVAHPAGTNVSAGMQAGPVCVTSTAQPGGSYTEPVSVVNSGNGWGKLDLSIQEINGEAGPSYEPKHPALYWLPRSWVSLGAPGWVAPGHTASTQVTINVPGDARKGRYDTSLVVTAYAQTTGIVHGRKVTSAFGAGAATSLDISVGAPPPRRAYCQGMGLVGYWPWVRPLPVCKHAVHLALCRVLPLPPPVANAKNCGWPTWKWAQYENQLRLAGIRDAHNAKAYLKDAHCIVDGRALEQENYYRRTGMYRFGTGQTGPVTNAPPANDSDSWRTAGTPHWNVRPPAQATRNA